MPSLRAARARLQQVHAAVVRGGRLRALRWASLLLLAAGLDRRADHRDHLADHRHSLLFSVPPAVEPDLGDVLWQPVALPQWW